MLVMAMPLPLPSPVPVPQVLLIQFLSNCMNVEK